MSYILLGLYSGIFQFDHNVGVFTSPSFLDFFKISEQFYELSVLPACFESVHEI